MTNARASATRCCPPDSCPGGARPYFRGPPLSVLSEPRSARVGPDICGCAANTRRSRTPTCAGIVRNSGTPCRCAGDAAAETVSTARRPEYRPCSARSNPASMRSTVVLPHPDGPRNVTNSPASMRKLKSRTAATLRPRERTNVLLRSRTSSAFAGGFTHGGSLRLLRAPVAAQEPRNAVYHCQNEHHQDHAQRRSFSDIAPVHSATGWSASRATSVETPRK